MYGLLELKRYSILPQYYPQDYVLYIYQWWKRFLDDCWLLWKDEFDLNVVFFNVINDLHPFRVSAPLSLLSQLSPVNPWILPQSGMIGGTFVRFTFLIYTCIYIYIQYIYIF